MGSLCPRRETSRKETYEAASGCCCLEQKVSVVVLLPAVSSSPLAQALGLTVPPGLLVAVDELIGIKSGTQGLAVGAPGPWRMVR